MRVTDFNSEQIIHIDRTPLFWKIFYLTVLAVVLFAFWTQPHKLMALWESSPVGKLLLVVAPLTLSFLTVEMFRAATFIAKEGVYKCNWRGCRYLCYKDFTEAFYTSQGIVFLGLKRSSRVEFSVPPSKLADVLEAITSAGCEVISLGK